MMQQLRCHVVDRFSSKFIPAHDVNHVLRVASLARQIAVAEGTDPDEAEAAALLHDVGLLELDQEGGHAAAGIAPARELLDICTAFPDAAKGRILDAIRQHSDQYSTGIIANILQDADRIDTLGALGVMRACVIARQFPEYVGDITAKPEIRLPQTIVGQIVSQLGSFDLLYTRAARQIAVSRHAWMHAFLVQLQQEIVSDAYEPPTCKHGCGINDRDRES